MFVLLFTIRLKFSYKNSKDIFDSENSIFIEFFSRETGPLFHSPFNKQKSINLLMGDKVNIIVPKSLKGYSFIQELGRGAFSVVCKVKSPSKGNVYACKVFPKANLTDQGDQERFQREINAMAFLQHENLVTLHDFFWDESNFYLIMDLCPGGELFDYIVDHDKLEEPIAALLFEQIASAIHYCHSLGVAHRDLKPENVLIDQFPRVKISDFGLCGYIQNQKLMKTFCGSPCYCSPECLCRVQYDGRLSDVWSLGVILYAMVTGEHPWNITNTSIMLRQILRGAYTIPSYVSKDCKDLITRMMQVNPRDRITMDDILKHKWLGLAKTAKVPKPPPTTQPEQKLPPLAGLSLEEISQASAESSQRSEHGIISPFEEDDGNKSELPKLCIRSQSVQSLLKKKEKGSLSFLGSDSENGSAAGRRRIKPIGSNLSVQQRQRSAANLLFPGKRKLPMHTTSNHQMTTIAEDD